MPFKDSKINNSTNQTKNSLRSSLKSQNPFPNKKLPSKSKNKPHHDLFGISKLQNKDKEPKIKSKSS